MSLESDLYKQLFKKNAIGEYLHDINADTNLRQNRKDSEMVQEREIIENSRTEMVGKSESSAVENEKNVKLERMKERERDQLGESVETVVSRSKFEKVKIEEEIQKSLAKTIEEMDETKVERTPRNIFTIAQSMNIEYYDKVTPVGDHVSGESSLLYDSESEMPLYESKPLPPQSHAKSASTPRNENRIKYPEVMYRMPIEESTTLPLNPPSQKSHSSLDLPVSDHTNPTHGVYHSVPLPSSPTLYELPCNHRYELSYLQSYLSLITLTCSPNNVIKCPSPDCLEYIDKSSLLAILLNHSPFTIEVCQSSTCCGYSISPKNSSIFQCSDCKKIQSIKFHT
jgi:hypothetical protein